MTIAVFASGTGSNFRALHDAIAGGSIPNARIALLISNVSMAGAMDLARERGIPTAHISRAQFTTDDEFATALLRVLQQHNINFIALAGYLKKLPAAVVRTYRNHILNIHPALLPRYGGSGMYGRFVHQAVLAARDQVSGATVHLVDDEYDHGPIVLQETVPVRETDTPETLAARVQMLEHQLYPEAIRLFAQGKVHIDGQHVIIVQ